MRHNDSSLKHEPYQFDRRTPVAGALANTRVMSHSKRQGPQRVRSVPMPHALAAQLIPGHRLWYEYAFPITVAQISVKPTAPRAQDAIFLHQSKV